MFSFMRVDLLYGHIWEDGFESGSDVDNHEVDIFRVRLQSAERKSLLSIHPNRQLQQQTKVNNI